MPVILNPEDYDCWLDPAASIGQLRALLCPFAAELMQAHEVSRAVNGVRNGTERVQRAC